VLFFLAEFRSGDQTFWNSFCHFSANSNENCQTFGKIRQTLETTKLKKIILMPTPRKEFSTFYWERN
jgi:hypothetical protein